jgi:glycosyltransferase 2 family protein
VSTRLRSALVLIATAVCLGWVLMGIDLNKAAGALGEVNWWLMLPLFASYLFTHLLRAWRYQLLVGPELTLRRSTLVCATGFLAVNVVPFRLGEFVRPYLLTRDEMPFGQGLGAVVLERLLDIAMLLGLLSIVAFFIDLPAAIQVGGIDVVRAGQRTAATTLTVGALGLVVLGIGGAPLRTWLTGRLRRLPLGDKVAELAGSLVSSLTALRATPWRALATLALSIAVWATTVLSVWIALHSFPGVPTTLTAATVVWTSTIAGLVALPTPGFFGSYEAFCLAALLLWGTDPDLGRTFAVFLHLTHFGFTVGIGVPALLAEGTSLRALVAESRAANS